ncbi:spore-associated protein A [Nocardiopsis flavescens]|uniref:Spore-associated protein A n=1 Tax=Nocardiopsis flavescens TaxID=758803 RepID=A0A1M6N5K1_9ACTN|nr:spore-associated protein A [Nocardiopsis flavescens]SHJ90886.1 hypothetical protein SAMN05421803_11168 [Nocardiopsis flavescens]
MHTFLKRAAVLASAVGVCVAGLAAPASAAVYGGQCGSGYGVVNSIGFPNDRGTTFLTYNNSNGNNCVVTIRTVPGAAAPMDAFIRITGTSGWEDDPGNYTTYAGPVYLSAAGRCVDWGGTIGTATLTEDETNCG